MNRRRQRGKTAARLANVRCLAWPSHGPALQANGGVSFRGSTCRACASRNTEVQTRPVGLSSDSLSEARPGAAPNLTRPLPHPGPRLRPFCASLSRPHSLLAAGDGSAMPVPPACADEPHDLIGGAGGLRLTRFDGGMATTPGDQIRPQSGVSNPGTCYAPDRYTALVPDSGELSDRQKGSGSRLKTAVIERENR
jgi:hypothetical protein